MKKNIALVMILAGIVHAGYAMDNLDSIALLLFSVLGHPRNISNN